MRKGRKEEELLLPPCVKKGVRPSVRPSPLEYVPLKEALPRQPPSERFRMSFTMDDPRRNGEQQKMNLE